MNAVEVDPLQSLFYSQRFPASRIKAISVSQDRWGEPDAEPKFSEKPTLLQLLDKPTRIQIYRISMTTYRIKPEEFYIFSCEKGRGQSLLHSLVWRTPRVLTDLKHIRL